MILALLWRVDGLRVAWQVGALRWVTGHPANDNARKRGLSVSQRSVSRVSAPIACGWHGCNTAALAGHARCSAHRGRHVPERAPLHADLCGFQGCTSVHAPNGYRCRRHKGKRGAGRSLIGPRSAP